MLLRTVGCPKFVHLPVTLVLRLIRGVSVSSRTAGRWLIFQNVCVTLERPGKLRICVETSDINTDFGEGVLSFFSSKYVICIIMQK